MSSNLRSGYKHALYTIDDYTTIFRNTCSARTIVYNRRTEREFSDYLDNTIKAVHTSSSRLGLGFGDFLDK